MILDLQEKREHPDGSRTVNCCMHQEHENGVGLDRRNKSRKAAEQAVTGKIRAANEAAIGKGQSPLEGGDQSGGVQTRKSLTPLRHPTIHLFTQQMLTIHLLCARHFSRCLEKITKRTDNNSSPGGASVLEEENRYETHK